ncbi:MULTISPECIES: apolipoprotein N-acyltransferase [Prochlorococcus]|uniref:apolipoprotein N-acyltransferase n=1 Tax=Prochlorococcus TaxID=1218 RepID=UPI001F4D0329|nr:MULTISPECIES: apolipoprotein N-acyltransferase [Prochlorococcus]
MSKYIIPGRALIGGGLAGLGLSSSFGGGIFAMSFGIALLWSISSYPMAAALWGICVVLLSHCWLLDLHPLTWLGISPFASYLITFLIWSFCGLLGGFLVGLWSWLAKLLFFKELQSDCLRSKFLSAFILAAIWGLGEVVLAKYPFFWIGISSSFFPQDRLIGGLAAWFGAGGLTVIQLLIGWWIWQVSLLFDSRKTWERLFPIGLLVIIVSHSMGWILLEKETTASSYSASVWQTNIPTREKFLSSRLKRLPISLQHALDESKEIGSELMIAPEGTLPLGQKLLSPSPIKLLTGGFREVNGKQRSSLLLINENQQTYSSFVDKHRLVPLGEWIPNLLSHSFKGLSAIGGLESGEPSRLFIWDGPPFAVAICYELSNGNALAKAVREGAQWLVSIANLDPYPIELQKQFLALAQLRSIEIGRDLISVANTGPTAFVSRSGVITQLISPNKEEVVKVSLPFSEKKTGYVKWGEKPLIITLFIALTLLIRLKTKFH